MKERGDNMRILVISDSHGQLGNLNEILKEAGKVDRVIHLGDAVGQDEEIREMCGCPAAREEGCSVALYGHTHVPDVSYCKDVLVMNPGSISRPRQASGRPTYGIVTIGSNGEARADTYSL